MALSSTQLKLMRRLLHSGTEAQIAHSIEKFHPSDLSLLFSELSPNETQRLVNSLFLISKAGKTILELPEFLIPDILDLIEDHKLAVIISRLEPDDALFLMEMIPEERWKIILEQLPPSQRAKLDKLLLHPKYSAGWVMTSNFIAVKSDQSVEQAIDTIRQHPEMQGIFYVYVVDEGFGLVGVISLRNLVMSRPGTMVKNVMTTEVHAVEANTSQEEAAQIVSQYNLLAVPVINENRKLIGVITVDDVIDIVEEEATEDIYHLAGLSEGDHALSPVSKKVRMRLPWMILNLFTAGLSAIVISFFEGSIEKVVALAVLMNVVASVGGNGGVQSLTVITRAIALGEMAFTKAYKIILKELANGFIIGLICGALMAGICYVWKGNIYLGIVLMVSMMANLIIGGSIGALVPITFKHLKLDPAVGTSVIVTMVTDTLGHLVFLGMATWMIQYLL